MPGGNQYVRLRLRAEEMKKLRQSGAGVREVAKAFGVSTRTVQREMNKIRRIKQ